MHIIAAHSVHYVILLHSYIVTMLTLNQPLTHKCVQSLNKSIRRIYMGVIILGANTSYINFCLFKQIPHGVQRVLRPYNNSTPDPSLYYSHMLTFRSLHKVSLCLVCLLTCVCDAPLLYYIG